MTDFYDDDYDLDTEDDQLSDESDYGDGDDSGNGESWISVIKYDFSFMNIIKKQTVRLSWNILQKFSMRNE